MAFIIKKTSYTEFTNWNLHLEAVEAAKVYRKNKPYPWIYFDGIWRGSLLHQILKEWRPLTHQYNDSDQKKHASELEKDFGPTVRSFLRFLNSHDFLEFLTTLTGIENLIPDPYFLGAGLHELKPGGHLGIHVDFNKHAQTKLDRRINVLIYLNEGWQPEYGGQFELWEGKKRTRGARSIDPIFNRMAIFSTTETSWHGNPATIRCPEGMSRKSIALYYYTNGREDYVSPAERVTTWAKNPPVKRILRQKVRDTVKIWAPGLLNEAKSN